MTDEPVRRKRAGGRAGMKVRAGTAVIDQMPWRIPVNPDAPVEPLDAEGVSRIHKTAMRILRDIGIEFRDEPALDQWRAAGADVQGARVRLDEAMVIDLVAKAPMRFTRHGRNPDIVVEIGPDTMTFGTMQGAPCVRDLMTYAAPRPLRTCAMSTA